MKKPGEISHILERFIYSGNFRANLNVYHNEGFLRFHRHYSPLERFILDPT